jgi:deoxycytidylate deaminase
MRYLSGSEEQEAIRWMREAGKAAEKALCLKAKCGTVIVAGGEIIGAGYNAPPLDNPDNRTCLEPYSPGKTGFDRTCCMHAEWRAILDASRRNPDRLPGSTLYFSRVDVDGAIKKAGDPYCTVCSRFALDAGIAEFLLWNETGICAYPTDEYDRLSYAYVDPNAAA